MLSYRFNAPSRRQFWGFLIVNAIVLVILLVAAWFNGQPAEASSVSDEVCHYPEPMTFDEREEFNLNNSYNLPYCFLFPNSGVSCIREQEYRQRCPDRFPEPVPYPGPPEGFPAPGESWPGEEPVAYPGPEAIPDSKPAKNTDPEFVAPLVQTEIPTTIERQSLVDRYMAWVDSLISRYWGFDR